MAQRILGLMFLAVLLGGAAPALGAPAPCRPIASAARSPGQISIPPVSLDLADATVPFSAATLRSLEGLFSQQDALVNVAGPRIYTGAAAEQVAQMAHMRLLELGPISSAFADGPALLEGGRWAGLYSDGDTDLLVLTEPIVGWPPHGVLLSALDVVAVSRLLATDAVIVTTYAGKGVVQAVCDGRATSVARFVVPEPKAPPLTGPGGCTDIAASPNEPVAQPEAVPRLSLSLSGVATRWPGLTQAALQRQIQDRTSQVTVAALTAYDAPLSEVVRRYVGRLTEHAGWRVAYPAGTRPVLGGGLAGLFSDGAVDVLVLAYPGASFPSDAMPFAVNDRRSLHEFLQNDGKPFGTVLIRYEGRGLVRAACAGQLDAVFRPQ